MADQHASQIRKLPSATLVAVCDAEPLMARQLAERFQIPAWITPATRSGRPIERARSRRSATVRESSCSTGRWMIEIVMITADHRTTICPYSGRVRLCEASAK